ncbi:cdf006f0-f919-4db2-bd3c-104b2af2c52d [Thermothielavioides terrestris]|uniref:alpha-galactosidase n=2 Tax=Thermothielavioides terrestris TaxID=2587410 RepID=G2R8A9_THETT|nr:glycoside hydrolase family 114 protein [Thermothielavioides terrestris NRRL 8126]AEO68168.1 glycoside hydrolase family 114 protein [Thermothielavioides terrestris NRRL 8126]SPQ24583.1 cdf006f0-f919-4db2-bd3c-104b2af2c52d [Thermothielavioides terrestris]
MKHVTPFAFAAGIAIGDALAQVRVPTNFQVGVKWQIEIQNTLDITKPLEPSDAVVWDLDLYHVARNPGIVDYLRKNDSNRILICYFNAGLAQTSDCDYNTRWNNSGLLGNVYDPEEPQFSDERWVNIKNQTARDWMKDRITLANQIGCDGVDPDNIDGYLNDEDGNNGTGWNLSQDDYVSFVTELAAHAHNLTTKRGFTLLIGQKNAADIVDRIDGVLDFAVLEDCKQLNDPTEQGFCSAFQPYITAGRPVFSIEYPSTLGNADSGACNPGGANATQYAASCDATAGNANFSTVLKIQGGVGELNGCTQYCDGGRPNTGVVVTATNSELDGSPCPAGSQ